MKGDTISKKNSRDIPKSPIAERNRGLRENTQAPQSVPPSPIAEANRELREKAKTEARSARKK